MKKIFWLLIATVVITACTKEAPDYSLISGKIENANGLNQVKVVGAYDFSQDLAVKEDGTFADTLKSMKTGFYAMQIGRANISLYLEQGDDLNVTIDLSNRENPLSFSKGNVVVVNEYLANRRIAAEKKISELGGMQGMIMLEEAEFVKIVKEMNEDGIKSLEETKNLSATFVELQKKTLEYNYLYNLSLYSDYHAYLTKKEDYEPSEIITAPLTELKYNNKEDYNQIGVYKQLVLTYFANKYYDDNADRNAVIEEIKSTGIEALAKDLAKNFVQRLGLGEENLSAEVDRIKSLTNDEEIIRNLDAFVKTAENLAQGKPSPKFEYADIKGKKVSLDDLKGKLVYIDVWATWCGPCKGEIPHLQKLEKDYHIKPIHFVSLSVDQDKAAWEKMVKEQKLGGIQLHADGAWEADFVKSYEIKGIPRFILLDKEGNIISADAPRPSTSEIRTLLDEWLKK